MGLELIAVAVFIVSVIYFCFLEGPSPHSRNDEWNDVTYTSSRSNYSSNISLQSAQRDLGWQQVRSRRSNHMSYAGAVNQSNRGRVTHGSHGWQQNIRTQPSSQCIGLRHVRDIHRDIFLVNNQHRARNVIDLHGLFCEEAADVAIECINVLRRENFRSVDLITGRGSHSENGVPRVKLAIQELLDSRNIRYAMENPGMVRASIQC